MNNSKRGQISANQFLFIIFVSRLAVSFTYIQAVSIGELKSEFLLSYAISYAMAILVCVPCVICSQKNKNPFNVKWVALLYSLYFIWMAGINISRFSYFASSKLNPNTSLFIFVVLISLCVCYCACLGLEPLARFGAFCGILLIITVIFVLIFNVENFNELNLYPVVDNSMKSILKNSVVLTANNVEPALYLALANRVNSNAPRQLFAGISFAYFTTFLLLLFVVGVMGNTAVLQGFPIYTLFQTASLGNLSRFDSLYTAIWVIALLLKTSVLVYCATLFTTAFKHTSKCVVFSVLALAVPICITLFLSTNMVKTTKIISSILFAIFIVAIPILTLIVKKNGGKNIENF